MNIFDALSQGKGKLNEENLSAMLAYILEGNQSHGLGDAFIRLFLKAVADENGDIELFKDILTSNNTIKSEVFLEMPYEVKNNKRFVDIEIKILSNGVLKNRQQEEKEIYRIFIENKIKADSAQKEQFKEEFIGVMNAIEDTDTKIVAVFLTPDSDSYKLKDEYEELTQDILGNHSKVWLKWTGRENSITSLIKDLLNMDKEIEIDPITDYVKHTLKALVRHIEKAQAQKLAKSSTMSFDAGQLTETFIIKLEDIKYKIEKYESGTITIFNLQEEQYEIVKPILRKINIEEGLNIDLNSSNGNQKNTRTLGKDILNALKEKYRN